MVFPDLQNTYVVGLPDAVCGHCRFWRRVQKRGECLHPLNSFNTGEYTERTFYIVETPEGFGCNHIEY